MKIIAELKKDQPYCGLARVAVVQSSQLPCTPFITGILRLKDFPFKDKETIDWNRIL